MPRREAPAKRRPASADSGGSTVFSVATCAGFLLVLYPWIVLVLGVVFFVIARVFRKASIGSLVCCVWFPILVAVFHPAWEAIATTALAVLVLSRHWPNIQRLLHGTELSTGSSGS